VHPQVNPNPTIDYRVEAFSRLHFGLLEIHPQAPHCFGGIGLMVDKPSVRLGLTRSLEPRLGSIQDPCFDWTDAHWKDRFLRVYSKWQSRTARACASSVELHFAPLPHVGLGSGTQFACAAAALLNRSMDSNPDNGQLDESWLVDSGRGLRSHIGLRGFLHGGLILDRGDSRAAVHTFPLQWRVVLLHESNYQGDFGESEQAIFDRCSERPNPNLRRMLELIEQQILPAVSRVDYQAACEGFGRYGELAGEIFRPAVGDAYRSSRIRFWVDRLRGLGFQGVGQSSWGPVVFAIARDEHQAAWLVKTIGRDMHSGGWTYVAKVAGPASMESGLSRIG
jgi:beta-ribofuranosylaminobenzene 5'-phosphate synthase